MRYRARKVFSRRLPGIVAFRVRRAIGRPRRGPVVYVPGTDVPLDWAATFARERAYVAAPAAWPVLILYTDAYLRAARTPGLGWEPLLTGDWEAHRVPGDHNSMIGDPHVDVLAARLAEAIECATLDMTPSSASP